MKKRVVTIILSATLGASLLAGCGKNSTNTTTVDAAPPTTTEVTQDTEVTPTATEAPVENPTEVSTEDTADKKESDDQNNNPDAAPTEENKDETGAEPTTEPATEDLTEVSTENPTEAAKPTEEAKPMEASTKEETFKSQLQTEYDKCLEQIQKDQPDRDLSKYYGFKITDHLIEVIFAEGLDSNDGKHYDITDFTSYQNALMEVAGNDYSLYSRYFVSIAYDNQ